MTAGPTYVSVASSTLSSNSTSITFSSIPGSYTDLILIVKGIFASGSTNDTALQFNSDTGTNYSWIRLLGNGSVASSGRQASDAQIDFGLMSSTNQTNSIAHIQNYSNTTSHKTVIGRGNSTEYVSLNVGAWRNTAAITSITVRSAATFVTGTIFSLYGIKAA